MADNNGWSIDPAPQSGGWSVDPSPEELQARKGWSIDPLGAREQTPLGKALSGGEDTSTTPEPSQLLKDTFGKRLPKAPAGTDQTSIPGYLAHGLESGIASIGAMGGDVAESFNPVSAARNAWLDIKDAAHQVINSTRPLTLPELVTGDKRGGDINAYLQTQAEKDASTPFTRFADRLTRESQDLAQTPDGQRYNSLIYATTDPAKSALLSPVRMIHDMLQSLPSTAAMATTVYLTRGAAVKAYSEALAAGFTKAEANTIAVTAAGKVATLAGGLGEGIVGGAQQASRHESRCSTTSIPSAHPSIRR
jgi:hypothetical protein